MSETDGAWIFDIAYCYACVGFAYRCIENAHMGDHGDCEDIGFSFSDGVLVLIIVSVCWEVAVGFRACIRRDALI